MNKKLKITTVLISIGTLVSAVWWLGTEAALCDRFPQFDAKIIRKIHREMIWETLTGKYGDEAYSDEELDVILLAKVRRYIASL